MEHHGHAHHQHTAADESTLAELLDLDAEVMQSYLSELTAWIRELTGDRPPRRILDLGCGTGTGTFALLRQFIGAEVVAVDSSAQMLHRLGDTARRLGLADQVHTVEADLDGAWPHIGAVDFVWASASLHHLADPHRVLTDVFGSLRPGGLLIAVEFDSFPRFLPEDVGLGRPGLEARCHAALAEGRAVDLPHLGDDWGPRLSQAGFAIEAERDFVIELAPPLPPSAGRYAQASLRRARSSLDGRISADDLATLDTLIDSHGPASVLRRDDLTVRAARSVWVARRP